MLIRTVKSNACLSQGMTSCAQKYKVQKHFYIKKKGVMIKTPELQSSI